MRAALIGLLLVACASPSPSVTASWPAVPEGWVRYTSSLRDVAVRVPPQMKLEDNTNGVLAGFVHPAPDSSSLGVLAIGAHGMTSQPTAPFTEASLSEWLLQTISTRRPETFTHDSVVLPVGSAVEVRFTFDAGTSDEVAVVGYAIPTSLGVAYLTANCQASPMTECDEFLRLVPLLLELSQPLPD